MPLLVALVTVLLAVPPLVGVQHRAAIQQLARLWQAQQTRAEMMERR